MLKDDAAGLDVCLYCFNGGCCTERHHSELHYHKTEHPLVLNIQRIRNKVNVGDSQSSAVLWAPKAISISCNADHLVV